ncbi:nuclear transport factor 2 family protein [Tenacibaculum xiamenense]|uniref:nuclear transport factor 2 family protein n=1 Tax=Tenacibaculum xiamenense TaxID=1261553 RepID=UPI003894117A
MDSIFDFFFKGNFLMKLLMLLYALLVSWFTNGQVHEIPQFQPKNQQLFEEISKMDATFFDAYNNCDMETQAKILSDDIEFFHDNTGLSTSKKDILNAIKNNICNKVTRTLIKGSIEVYPIHNYGAVEIGYHKFFNSQEPNAKSIPSKFITIWKKSNDQWLITKVVSLH